ncbi:MAG: hypothetical protein MMC23_002837 [Stictis urceolatum]|nr:hypothetical protein [Stictis urceolata]
MSALEQPFLDAISANEIDSVLITGKDTSGHTYTKTFGTRTLLSGASTPHIPSDIIFLASATKLLTTIAALQCVERKQLTLHSPAPLPTFLTSQPILCGWTDSKIPILKPNPNSITLAHLLTHSSGLAYDFFVPDLKRWASEHPSQQGVIDVPSACTQPLVFAPGEGWMYGAGIDWAGWLVEQVSGLRLDDYLRRHVLEPLGISPGELSFFPVKEGLGERMVDLNPEDKEGAGLSVTKGANIHQGVEVCFGGGGAYMAGAEYVRVLESLLRDDGKLLGSEMRREMFRPQLEGKAREVFHEMLGSPAGAFFGNGTGGKNRDFGLGGLMVGEDGDTGLGLGSLTWGGGINSAWFIDPKNGTCGFAAPQLGMPPNADKATELKAVFRSELNAQLLKNAA